MFNVTVKEIKGDTTRVEGLVIEDSLTKNTQTILVQGIFLAIGSSPRTSIFKDKLQLHDNGFIILKNAQETSRKGIFAAGDVCDSIFVQAVTSSGHGCMAAIQAKKFLDSVGFDQDIYLKSVNVDQAQDSFDVVTRGEKDSERPRPSGIRDIPRLTIRSQYPTVIKIYSQLCIPCQRMEPIFRNVEKQYEDVVKFIEIDAAHPPAPLKEIEKMLGSDEIKVLPTFLFVKNGKEVSRLVGLRYQEEFNREIQKILVK